MNKATGLFESVKNGFKNLTKREQVMIYGLVTVVVLAVLVFLIVLPAMTRLSELSEEVSKQEAKEQEMRLTISQLESFGVRYEAASKSLIELKKGFFLPMDPESLDETITTLIVQSGLSPKDLQMTTLQQGIVPEFKMQPLPTAGMPSADTGGTTTEDGSVPGTTGEGNDTTTENDTATENDGMGDDGPTAENDEGTGDPNEAIGVEAFIYTVTVRAEGNKTDLGELIDTVNNTSGIELNSYSYSLGEDSASETSLDADTVVIGGTLNLEFYVYVYVDITTGVVYPEMGTTE